MKVLLVSLIAISSFFFIFSKDILDQFMSIKDKLSSEYAYKLSDFKPEYFYSFEIPVKRKFTFYETIDTPNDIKGFFIVQGNYGERVTLLVKELETGNVYYDNTSSEHIFNFKLYRLGKYEIIFENRFVNTPITVIFSLETGQNQVLNNTELEKTHHKITSLDNYMKSVFVDQDILRNKFNERVKSKNFIISPFIKYKINVFIHIF